MGNMSKLGEIAQINEEIKRIVEIAEGISLTAINAMLVAKQSGVTSIGFGVVARELRKFSEQMTLIMQELTKKIFGLLRVVAHQMNRERLMRCLCDAGKHGGASYDYIEDSCKCSRKALSADMQKAHKLSDELLVTLTRVEKQCVMGLAVGRAAKIEAAYGGALQSVLKQIAEGVETTIGDVLTRVRGLEVRLMEFTV